MEETDYNGDSSVQSLRYKYECVASGAYNIWYIGFLCHTSYILRYTRYTLKIWEPVPVRRMSINEDSLGGIERAR